MERIDITNGHLVVGVLPPSVAASSS